MLLVQIKLRELDNAPEFRPNRKSNTQVVDHEQAAQDHEQAAQDNERAAQDHKQATQDREQASKAVWAAIKKIQP